MIFELKIDCLGAFHGFKPADSVFQSRVSHVRMGVTPVGNSQSLSLYRCCQVNCQARNLKKELSVFPTRYELNFFQEGIRLATNTFCAMRLSGCWAFVIKWNLSVDRWSAEIWLQLLECDILDITERCWHGLFHQSIFYDMCCNCNIVAVEGLLQLSRQSVTIFFWFWYLTLTSWGWPIFDSWQIIQTARGKLCCCSPNPGQNVKNKFIQSVRSPKEQSCGDL